MDRVASQGMVQGMTILGAAAASATLFWYLSTKRTEEEEEAVKDEELPTGSVAALVGSSNKQTLGSRESQQRCLSCTAQPTKPLRCARCKQAWFCSVQVPFPFCMYLQDACICARAVCACAHYPPMPTFLHASMRECACGVVRCSASVRPGRLIAPLAAPQTPRHNHNRTNL